MKVAAKWLFIVCLPFLLLMGSVSWTVNSQWLYQYGFDRYGVSQTTGLTRAELGIAAAGLIDYFNSSDENISLIVMKDGKAFELFNEREVAHLRDVKGLFRLVYRVLLGTLIYALAYIFLSIFLWKDRWRLAWGLVGGSCLTLVMMLVLGLGILLNFDRLFLQFHLISFANDLWLLDPSRDYLIMLFPRDLWYSVFLFWALATIVGALILGGVGWWCLKKKSEP